LAEVSRRGRTLMRTAARDRLAEAAIAIGPASEKAATTAAAHQAALGLHSQAEASFGATQAAQVGGEDLAAGIMRSVAAGQLPDLSLAAPADGGRARAAAAATVEATRSATAVLAREHRQALGGEAAAERELNLAVRAVGHEVEAELVRRGLDAIAELGRVRRALAGLDAAWWTQVDGAMRPLNFGPEAVTLMRSGVDMLSPKGLEDQKRQWLEFRAALRSDPDAVPPDHDPGDPADELAAFQRKQAG
jgi:hypothetical protein